jgi:flagellar biosynthesis protein FlhG
MASPSLNDLNSHLFRDLARFVHKDHHGKRVGTMAVSIAITSGKGGAGKSSIAVNLSLRLAEKHGSTLFLDTDFGMANGHILLNVKPEHDVVDVLDNQMPLQNALHDGPGKLKVLAGRPSATEMFNLERDKAGELVRHCQIVEDDFDYLVVDTAAGASDSTLVSAAAADRVVVVLLGQATSFIDAYSVIKGAYQVNGVECFSIVVNMARSMQDARSVFDTFRKTVTRFLPVHLSYCGHIPYSRLFHKAAIECRPVALQRGAAPEIFALDSVADRILGSPASITGGLRYFTHRIGGDALVS